VNRTPLAVGLEGARRRDDLGVEVPADYGDPAGELGALRGTAAVVDRSARGFVQVTGADAASFLQQMVSADLDAVGDGEGARSLLLTPQGKLTADFRVLRVAADDLWLDGDVGVGAVLAETLARFRIRVQVELTDRTGEWGMLTVRGPQAGARVGSTLDVAVPSAPHAHVDVGEGLRLVRSDWPGAPGVDLVGPVGALADAWGALVGAGVARAGLDALEAVRVEAGVPRQGLELDGRTIAQEAFLDREAVSFSKGCFMGQELVCRIDTRGHVNRYLRGIRFADGVVPPVGADLVVGERAVGMLTTVAAPLVPAALGFVRREVEPGADVVVRWDGDEVPARVVELPA